LPDEGCVKSASFAARLCNANPERLQPRGRGALGVEKTRPPRLSISTSSIYWHRDRKESIFLKDRIQVGEKVKIVLDRTGILSSPSTILVREPEETATGPASTPRKSKSTLIFRVQPLKKVHIDRVH
jgi:hypothetical protein